MLLIVRHATLITNYPQIAHVNENDKLDRTNDCAVIGNLLSDNVTI